MKRLSTRLLKILIVPVLILVLAAVAQADSAPTPTDPAGDGGHPILNTSRVTPPIANSVLLAVSDVDTANLTTLQSELLALGITTVDLFSAISATTTLAQLLNYDAVITWSNGIFQDPVAMGNVLGAYADAGGGVVLGNFVWYAPFDLGGAIQGPGYSPFEEAGPSLYTDACLGTPVHTFPPIMTFVHTACDYFRDNVIVGARRARSGLVGGRCPLRGDQPQRKRGGHNLLPG